MKTLSTTLFFAVFAIIFSVTPIGDAHAKRFGGGRSFGSKPSYSNPYRRSATSTTRSASQKQAAARNQAARNSMARRGGLMGLLGGLALGGLLGSLLFGGAFENLNLFDILVFGGIAYLLYRIFASGQKRAPAYHRGSGAGTAKPHQEDFSRYDRTAHNEASPRDFDTDLLFRKDSADSGSRPLSAETDATFSDQPRPADFNEEDFLHGAKIAYQTLQHAWDTGDLAEIRGLTSDHVFSEIQQQIHNRDANSQTEVIRLDAELLAVRETGSDLEASVLFDAILTESADQRPEQVREIWHFIRPLNSGQPTWFVDGIQQMDDQV